MALSEGVSASIRYKHHTTGNIAANTLLVPSVDPGSSGGQILRRVSSTLSFAKNTYQSAEVRSDRQIADFRHGSGRIQGAITGELSPSTIFDLIEAAHRDTKQATLTLTESTLTSAAASSTASTFTFGAGNPVSLGLRVGNLIRFAGMSAGGNNSRNYLIRGFSGTNNRTVKVTPPPVGQTADTAFTVTRPGAASILPATGHIKRLFAIEEYNSDNDMSRLFTELRAAGYRLNMPAEGMATFELPFMGRHQTIFEDSFAPFFGSPAAETTTGICAAVDGTLLLNDSEVGVVTAVDMTLDLSPSAAVVSGQNFPAEIFLGRGNLTGTLTAFLEDATILNNFSNEDELSLQLLLNSDNSADTDAVSIYLPRIKFSAADLPLQGEGGQTISAPFQALRQMNPATGADSTTISIHDTAAS